jgi:hypothetical protein
MVGVAWRGGAVAQLPRPRGVGLAGGLPQPDNSGFVLKR